MVEAIRANNVPVECVIFPDEGHGFLKKENQIKGYGQIVRFLDTYLAERKQTLKQEMDVEKQAEGSRQ